MVYCNWKIPRKIKQRSKFWKIFGNEHKSLVVYKPLIQFLLIVIVILLGVYTLISDGYYVMYVSFDWYDPNTVDVYKFINQTYWHMIEVTVLCVCYMKHRHYPREFNIAREILWATVLNYLFNNQLEVISIIHWIDNTGCLLNIIHFRAFSDCVKALGFIGVLWYLTNKSDNYFPLPFTWIFKDLSKFIFEKTCLKVYRNYLIQMEPDGRLA